MKVRDESTLQSTNRNDNLQQYYIIWFIIGSTHIGLGVDCFECTVRKESNARAPRFPNPTENNDSGVAKLSIQDAVLTLADYGNS